MPESPGPASPQGPKQLTAWEKADIVGKLLSGVVLGLIAVLIKFGADDITAAQKEGELVQSLLQDLTTKDQHTRQDLALIALDHSVGAKNPALVIDIAERLVLDTSTYTPGDHAASQALGGIAFRILQRRDSSRAGSLKRQLERQYEQQVASDSSLREALRSPADTGKPLPQLPRASQATGSTGSLLARLSSNVVFIQYQGNAQRALVDTLRVQLAAAGFVAPGVERVIIPFKPSIRYFHSTDLILADSVASMTQDFLSARDINATVPVQLVATKGVSVPTGQLEVWLSW